ncbi:unnamed protein product [Bursaphelenchus okinawaensis]|uniref:Uncharacterized protein n=1 Tax=Bursaphelenchus okinawaensis TaxID=465554 RepID=A0A811L5V1_9BILA|nr:unnamed protein product [Bursaphelenchus okinawaensis]CAG9118039.1 unnamed protein product [Bursaphelenchus okinawaensis]
MVRISLRNDLKQKLSKYASKLYKITKQLRWVLVLVSAVTILFYLFLMNRQEFKMLIVDPDCLKKIESNLPCAAPVTVALIHKNTSIEDLFTKADYVMNPAEDFSTIIEFKPRLNSFDSKISAKLLPRFVIKDHVNVLFNRDGALKSVDVSLPADFNQFKRFWNCGTLVHCKQVNTGLEDSSFAYEKLRERGDLFGAQIFIIANTSKLWYNTCLLPSQINVGINSEQFSEYLQHDFSQHFIVTQVYGKRESSMQMNIEVENVKVVLNVLYKNSEKERKYVVEDSKTMFIPNYLNLCTANANNVAVYVPCDVMKDKWVFEPVY